MAYYATPEEIAQARQMDALTYLRQYEPEELVRVSSHIYSTKAHDSMKIKSDGRWYWWSRRKGGHTALDYIIAVKGMSLPEAVNYLTGEGKYIPPRETFIDSNKKSACTKEVKAEFVLPKSHTDNRRVFAYLLSRGIDAEIINHCIKHGFLYEEAEFKDKSGKLCHNAVFVGLDNNNTAKYATLRSTMSGSTFLRDVDGSDKRYCFSLDSKEQKNTVYLFESAIDALSFATLIKLNGQSWREFNLLSLGGIYKQARDSPADIPMALNQYLQDHPDTKKVMLCLDNDDVGRGAAKLITDCLGGYEVKDFPPPQGKDYNDYLHHRKGIKPKVKTRVNERSR